MKIAVVGGDGAGKSSATKVLFAELKKRDLRIQKIDKWDVLRHDIYPEYRFMSGELKDLKRCVSDMQPVTRTFFFFWTLHGTIQSHLIDGMDVVLLDGYWPKHAAAEALYSGCRDLIETSIGYLPKADLTVFLDVDPEIAYERRSADEKTPLVPYECGMDLALSKEGFVRHQAKCRSILREWCDNQGWIKIDANQVPSKVHDELLAHVTHRLDSRSTLPVGGI